MANMSYCAFENTYGEVQQCISLVQEEIDGEFTISPREWDYAQDLVTKLSKLKRLVEELSALREQDASPDGVIR
jgi:hypothetical protein